MNMLFHGDEIVNDFVKSKRFLDENDFYDSGLFGGLSVAIATQ
jgi:hypothetical protein